MNIKRAKQEIKDAIEAYLLKDEYGDYVIPVIRQRPVLLIGAPGIGKTQIMEQIASECRIGLVAYTITHHTRQSAIGLPMISKKEFGGKEYSVTEYTMSEIVASVYEKIEQTGLQEGILFIDEINCVSETLAPAMLQFLQCKTFGNQAIPKGWLIVAAGNPPEYNKSVREFDVVTMDRVRKIEVEPDFEAWKEYAYREEIHPAVISYLNIRPRYFYQMENTVDGRRFATPRGWEDLSRILCVYEKLGKPLDREVTEQYIQYPKAAKDFAAYLELYYQYQADYQLDEIFKGHFDPILLKKTAHASFDERLGVIGLLLSRCSVHFKQVCRLQGVLEKLQQELKGWKAQMAEQEQMAASEQMAGEGQMTGQEQMASQEQMVSQEHMASSADLLEQDAARLRLQMEREKEAGILPREEELALRMAADRLDAYVLSLKKSGCRENEEAFNQVRESYNALCADYREKKEEAGSDLEYAFDFLEAAFLQGQEMVIFITELNMNSYCVKFLQEYECERYYRYNKELLFEDRQRDLLRRIDELEEV